MDALHALTEINLDDLVSSFGWQSAPLPASLLRRVFHAPAAKFARQMLAFDNAIANIALPSAARQTLKNYAETVTIHSANNVPANGPLIFLSNHPGMADTLALFIAINRPDLRIIALDRPFLKSLPNTTEHLFFISEDTAARMRAVKQVANHLKNGGAVLTFPAGHIEPDADVYPGALESLSAWTDSAGVFLRFAPQARIVPVFVRGVLWEKAVKHPLTRIKTDREERERLGAALQLLSHIVLDQHPVHISVQFAPPLTLEEIGSSETAAIHAAVIDRMQTLIAQDPAHLSGRPIQL